MDEENSILNSQSKENCYKRFLNVLYENQPAEIDIGTMVRFSEVQKEVLFAFKEIKIGYARVQLWNDTANMQFNDINMIKALPEEFYWEAKKAGALYLTVRLLPNPLVSSEDTISLSVQGSLFVLKRKTILSFDWMVARMLNSSIPSSNNQDLIYIDVDPTCFRLILSILKRLINFQSEVSRIATTELVVLKGAAAYLLCDSIVHKIETHETEMQKLTAERDNLASQLAESKRSDDFYVIEAIKKVPIRVFTCNGYKTCRPYNICAAETIVIGNNIKCISDSLVCSICDNCTARNYSMHLVKDMNYLATTLNDLNQMISISSQ
jgi:hypothetical protein